MYIDIGVIRYLQLLGLTRAVFVTSLLVTRAISALSYICASVMYGSLVSFDQRA